MKGRGRSRLLPFALVAALVAGGLAAGCGEEEELDVIEGEPVEIGGVSYNVRITRFVNRQAPDDEGFLEGVPEPPPGERYLATFLTIENESDSPAEIPTDFHVVDTQGEDFPAVQSASVFALELGSTIPPDGEVPESGSPAATGPVGGSLILFQVDENVTENRPLELVIPAEGGEEGRVQLDI